MKAGISTRRVVFTLFPLVAGVLLYFENRDGNFRLPDKASSETSASIEQGVPTAKAKEALVSVDKVSTSEPDAQSNKIILSTTPAEGPQFEKGLTEEEQIAVIVSQLPPEAKKTWRLHELKKSVSSRLDSLESAAITQPELTILLSDIDHLDQKGVFLPSEAASLKDYVSGHARIR